MQRASLANPWKNSRARPKRNWLEASWFFQGVAELLIGKIVQPAPDEVGAAAEINDATGEAFVHGDVGFAGEGISGVKTVSVTANAAFVAQGLHESLAERDAAIFDGVVGIHFEVAIATEG